jgi:pimeloyl-ACP methyl ester carboxylesterase
MHRHPAQALDSERVRGLPGQAAMAWRAGAAAAWRAEAVTAWRAEAVTAQPAGAVTAWRAGAAAARPADQARRDQQSAQAIATVVCLHASASSGRQWQALGRRLAGRYRVLSPDLYGAGNSPPWPADRQPSIADEVALLEPVFEAAGEPVHLIGHSYGGAVAARAALTYPGRFRSLVLIEPVLFGLLLAQDPGQPAAREVVAVCQDTRIAVELGALDGAARRFIDYWMGPGAWAGMPPHRRAAAARAMRTVSSEWSAIFADTTPLTAYASLDLPTLYLVGGKSPASTRAVARLLTQVLPDVSTAELAEAGHMAPITHPDLVSGAIEAHIAQLT